MDNLTDEQIKEIDKRLVNLLSKFVKFDLSLKTDLSLESIGKLNYNFYVQQECYQISKNEDIKKYGIFTDGLTCCWALILFGKEETLFAHVNGNSISRNMDKRYTDWTADFGAFREFLDRNVGSLKMLRVGYGTDKDFSKTHNYDYLNNNMSKYVTEEMLISIECENKHLAVMFEPDRLLVKLGNFRDDDTVLSITNPWGLSNQQYDDEYYSKDTKFHYIDLKKYL